MASRAKHPGRGRIRIVAGRWRGRLLQVPRIEGLRPTPDRIRETVFNWLAPEIAAAEVLDLYAGSGILGLEALSRGAARAEFVERQPQLASAIADSLVSLRAGPHAKIVRADVIQYLRGPARAVDGVFADPPYQQVDHQQLCTLLAEGGWLRDDAWVYLEQSAKAGEPELPPEFTINKSKTGGQVRYMLARYRSIEEGSP